eukprot:6455668-Pyramimonas_sp.AAC.1
MGSLGVVKGVLTTVNVSCVRGLTEYLAEAPEGDLLAVQQHVALAAGPGARPGLARAVGPTPGHGCSSARGVGRGGAPRAQRDL